MLHQLDLLGILLMIILHHPLEDIFTIVFLYISLGGETTAE